MYFEKEKYPFIVELIRGKKLDELIKMPARDIHPTFREYLAVMQFKDQLGENFIVTVYESVELWQDPQVIDIFALSQ